MTNEEFSEEENAIICILLDSINDDHTKITLDDARRMAKNLIKAGYTAKKGE